MENKDEGIFNAIKPKATVWECPKMNTPEEMVDSLTKLAKKQYASKIDVYEEMFKKHKAIKVTK